MGRWTHCKVGHELTDDNVYLRSNGRRECLTCRRARKFKKRQPFPHGTAYGYRKGCLCDSCHAAGHFASRKDDPRVALECYCHARWYVVTMQAVMSGRTISCGPNCGPKAAAA
jgi:hypothetical protein